MVILQRLKTLFISGLTLTLKSLAFYVGWIIRGFNFNPMLGDFFAGLQKAWGKSSLYSHRSALQTNYNYYIHKVGFLLYLPLVWDILKLVYGLFNKAEEPAKKKKTKSNRFAKAPSAEIPKAPGTEVGEQASLVALSSALAPSSEENSGTLPQDPGPSHLRRYKIRRTPSASGALSMLISDNASKSPKP